MCEFISKRVVCTAATILALAPAQAFACPVCALVGSGDNAWAYTAMSVMLIVLPLGMIAGTVLWLSRKAANADVELPSPVPSLDSGHAPAPALGLTHPMTVKQLTAAEADGARIASRALI